MTIVKFTDLFLPKDGKEHMLNSESIIYSIRLKVLLLLSRLLQKIWVRVLRHLK